MADNLTPEQRRKAMRAVKSSDTSLELVMDSRLKVTKRRYQRNVATLPGKPDFVFHRRKVAVFVDGDFWHGWRFPQWKHKLTIYWQKKIERTRQRDRRTFQRLRRAGWKVVRVWGHEVLADADSAVSKIMRALAQQM